MCTDRFFGERPYRVIIRNGDYTVTGNVADPKWLHERRGDEEREREGGQKERDEKLKMKRRRTTRNPEQSPPTRLSIPVKGRSVKSITRSALFQAADDLRRFLNYDFGLEQAKERVTGIAGPIESRSRVSNAEY